MLAYLWIAGDLRLATTKANEHHTRTVYYLILMYSKFFITFGQDSLVATHGI